MSTFPARAVVSLVAAFATALALGACGGHGTLGAGAIAAHAAPSPRIRFDNDTRERVHVYLVGERREWLLGRLEPGAAAWLPVPERALTDERGTVRLAVVAGGATLAAAREARTTFTMAQPALALLGQRWTFAQGRLVPRPDDAWRR